MKWSDIRELAEALADAHAETNPRTIRFTDLHAWITALPGFSDDPRRSNEKILEAIQMAWIDEVS
jgi:FeS assembly protein IscX